MRPSFRGELKEFRVGAELLSMQTSLRGVCSSLLGGEERMGAEEVTEEQQELERSLGTGLWETELERRTSPR